MSGAARSNVDALLKRSILKIKDLEARLAEAERTRSEPCAVVGLACRFPGGDTAERFWDSLEAGTDSIREIPAARRFSFREGDIDPSIPARAGLIEDVDRFDPAFFGISPREAVTLDPQQRLLLEVVWESLEDAGIVPASLRGSKTGVFVGLINVDYRSHFAPDAEPDPHTATGILPSVAAGRVSFVLGLMGPSMIIDTACSSSLVATHLACSSLRSGESAVALAAGVNLILTESSTKILARTQALSPDGRCRTFDAGANGYVRGEGCGVLVLKRLSDAQRDGNRIWAVIRGSAVNHDGRSTGLTAPNVRSQEAVIEQALRNANVAAADVSYIEAHGTGTPLGDPIEIDAIKAVYGKHRPEDARCWIGSLKTNIGHLESAAGVAGLAKVILGMKHQRIPKHLHFRHLNPRISLTDTPFTIPTETIDWAPQKGRRLGAVSSFGFSGTNAHVVLEEAPAVKPPPVEPPPVEPGAHVVTLSAVEPELLRAQARRLADHLRLQPGLTLPDIAFTSTAERTHFRHRLALLPPSREALLDGLAAVVDGRGTVPHIRGTADPGGTGALALLFTGLGSVYPGMGRGLYEASPIFRATLDRCAQLLAADLPAGPSLLEVMFAQPATSQAELLAQPAFGQPAVFALGYALFELWSSWGVTADLAFGHGVGELTAACAAGVFSLADGLKLVAARGRLAQSLSNGASVVALRAPEAAVTEALADRAEHVFVAAVNSPSQTVIAGGSAEVEAVASWFESEGVTALRLGTRPSIPDPQGKLTSNPALVALKTVAEAIEYRPGTLALVGGGGAVLSADEIGTPSYWVEQASAGVRLSTAVDTLCRQGARTFIEVGPRPTLLSLASALIPEHESASLLPCLREDADDWSVLTQSLCRWHVAGGAVDWRAFGGQRGGHSVALPTYPFKKDRYWIEAPPQAAAGGQFGSAGRYRLSGSALELPGQIEHHVLPVGPAHQSYLADHLVYGAMVVPAAFHLSVVLAVAADRWGTSSATLENVHFLRPLVIEGEDRVHVTLAPLGDDRARFAVMTRDGNAWLTHVEGLVGAGATAPALPLDLDHARATCGRSIDVDAIYESLSSYAIDWGPKWRWLGEVQAGGTTVLVRFDAPEAVDADEAPLHPALIDNSFIGSGAWALDPSAPAPDATPRVPFSVEALRWYGGGRPVSHCAGGPRAPNDDAAPSDFVLFDDSATVVAEIQGLSLRQAPRDAFGALKPSAAAAAPESALFTLSWKPLGPLPAPAALSGHWIVLSATDDGQTLVDQIERGGARASLATLGPAALDGTDRDAVRAWFDSASAAAPVAGIICDWGRGLIGPDEAEADAAARTAVAGLHVAQAISMLAAEAESAPTVIWATSGGATLSAGAPTLVTAPLWGLARTWFVEHPELRATLVDTDDVSALLGLAGTDDGERQVALRDGDRYALRLGRAPSDAAAEKTDLCTDGAVVVTGGLGALGLQVAQWLVDRHGVEQLVLIGRSPPSEAATEAIDALRASGASVTVSRADVSDRVALQAVLSEQGRIRGVVHAAGVLDDGLLADQDAARFSRVLAPKVAGAWNLHSLLQDADLDFFVLFSSSASLLATGGQSNYGAANAFMDALAQHRRGLGLPALSVNWGPWASGGMAQGLDDAGRSRLARFGLGAFEPAQGLSLLEAALARPEAQVVAMLIDLDAGLPASMVPPLLADLIQLGRRDLGAGTLAPRLSRTPEGQRSRVVEGALADAVAKVLGLPSSSALAVDRPLSELGLDSLMAVELRNELSALVGQQLPASLAFDHPTVQALSRYLLANVISVDEAPPPVAAVSRSAVPADEPIAIVGMGCRFPGGVQSVDDFWDLLDEGRDAITEIPAERWDIDAWYDPDPDAPGKMYTRWGGFVPDIDQFDADFFEISPREAMSLDPQQRLLLEVAWEALEHAGQTRKGLMDSATGVYVGVCSTEYQAHVVGRPEDIDAYAGTGTAHSTSVGRLSYWLGLRGPNVPVDTACSSSLVAIHLACQSLRSSECNLALAGGVNVTLSPEPTVYFSKARAMSPTGRCRSFDASADGYVRSEGCGVVVLKRLSDALADGDRIAAVIRGTAVNQDGRSQGMTAPNGPSQEAVIRRALEQARVQPSGVDYVEAHGTGTPLGDPIEVQALAAVAGTDRERPVLIGSVKSNIGHTEAAAGVAGLIKAALALEHGKIPRSLHCDTPSPYIPWQDVPVRVASEPVPWPAGARPRFAGVSSFGFSGTNAHIVVGEAPPHRPQAELQLRAKVDPQDNLPDAHLHVLPVSGAQPAATDAQVARLAQHLAEHPEVEVSDLAFSLATTRSHFADRRAFLARTSEQLVEALSSPRLATRTIAELPVGGKVAFLFSGAGAQYPGMGRGLYRTQPVFRSALDRCAQILGRRLHPPLLDVLFAEPGTANARLLDRPELASPAVFAVEYAVLQLWQSFGVLADALLGYGNGEVAAACAAGVFSLEDALELVAAEGRLLQAAPPTGLMASIAVPEAEVRAALLGTEVGVAATNGPSTVISGPQAQVIALLDGFAARGLPAIRLAGEHALHCPVIEPVLAGLRSVAESIRYQPPSIPLVSATTGGLVTDEVVDPSYWVQRLSKTIRFDAAINAIAEQGVGGFIELGPEPVLLSLAAACLPAFGTSLLLPSLCSGLAESAVLLHSVARWYAQGGDVDWQAVEGHYGGEAIALPTYPFQRQRYWVERPERAGAIVAEGEATGHPLLGVHKAIAGRGAVYEAVVGANTLPYLGAHVVFGQVVVPGAAILELATAAGSMRFGPGSSVVEGLLLQSPLSIEEGGARRVQVVVGAEESGRASLGVYSRPAAAGAGADWTMHATASLSIAEPGGASLANGALEAREVASLRDLPGGRAVDPRAIYRTLHASGLEYGAAFRGMQSLVTLDGTAVGRVCLQTPEADSVDQYGIHPALLDAALQVMIGALPIEETPQLYLPFEVGAFQLYATGATEAWVEARTSIDGSSGGEVLSADVSLWDRSGAPLALVSGLKVKRTDPASLARVDPGPKTDCVYELAWRPLVGAEPSVAAVGSWILATDGAPSVHRDALARSLEAAGAQIVCCDGKQAFESALSAEGPVAGIILLWGAGDDESPAVEAERRSITGLGYLQVILQTPPGRVSAGRRRLWLVTTAAQSVSSLEPVAVGAAPLWGLGRAWQQEHPEWATTLVDVAPDVEAEALWASLGLPVAETQVVIRRDQLLGARLIKAAVHTTTAADDSESYALVCNEPGSFDRLEIVPAQRRAPRPGEVEIQVEATGLNFRDVLTVLGMVPEPVPLGLECAGVIARVGPGVSRFAVGDRVMALAQACFSRFTTVDAQLVAAVPAGSSAEQAAGLPMAFLTALYALDDLAGLERGERVLIHSASSGVGSAAVQVAKLRGAEVFATASPSKWGALQGLGVEHIASSRDTDFAEAFLAATDGQGVDVVLGAASPTMVDAGLSILRDGGRYLEMGKSDRRSPADVAASHPGVSHHTFELGEAGPERLQALFTTLVADVEAGRLEPLPVRSFHSSAASAAFRWMRHGHHLGKLVLLPMASASDGTVVITGGLGALGLEVAKWLVDGRRAKGLVLLGRSEPSAAASEVVEELRRRGAVVTVAQADITDRDALQDVLTSIADDQPLRGVVHAAGVLDDGLIENQTEARFSTVLAPKVRGAWNLHQLTEQADLAFFVMFSSTASLLGSAGQTNYAAANAFLDGLAHHRRAQGLVATSINWGPWSGAGMTTRMAPADLARLDRYGFGSIDPEQGLAILGSALVHSAAELAVLSLDTRRMQKAWPSGAAPAMFKELLGAQQSHRRASSSSAATERLEPLAATERHAALTQMLAERVASVLGLPSSAPVSPDRPLQEMGLDSLMAVELRNKVADLIGQPLSATLMFDYPTIGKLASHLLDEVLALGAATAPVLQPRFGAVASDQPIEPIEPIAIVGMGCRFPGGVIDPDSYWSLLDQGVDAIAEVPPERWDIDAVYDPDPSVAGKMMTRSMGFIQDVDQFDPAFFDIAPREAKAMDPQHRLLLETSWEALERAGICRDALLGSPTGVFFGIMSHDYERVHQAPLEMLHGYFATGSAASVASGRLSYLMGLTGPSMTIDTACSSSLVATHLACQSLRSGECNTAIVGGATVVLTPELHVEFSRLRGLAPDGRCKSFDASADGVAWSEGCGALVLKRLTDARRDGDEVLAVIRGTAVNQDGRSQGLTAPNGPSQQSVIQSALAQAGLPPSAIDYVEAHGTGTSLGDPIELQALGAVFADGHSDADPLLVGSVKSNFGHTQAAAGVAGIIKTVLAMQHGEIPKSLHFETPSPHLPWAELPVRVVEEPVHWRRRNQRPRTAGVSSFGISGTNAHVVLEEAPGSVPRNRPSSHISSPPPALGGAARPRPSSPPVARLGANGVGAPAYASEPVPGSLIPAPGALELVPLSARSDAALRAQATSLAAHLHAHPDLALRDVVFSLATDRTHFERRAAIVCRSRDGLLSELEAVADGRRPIIEAVPGRQAFIISGAASSRGGAQLYEHEPIFKGAIDTCAERLAATLKLREVLFDTSGSEHTAVAQLCLAYALSELWRSWGVRPDAVLGHGTGVIAAACVAGAIALEDALDLASAWAPLTEPTHAGAMLAVRASEPAVAEIIGDSAASIAAVYGPSHVVVTGPVASIAAVEARLLAGAVLTKRLGSTHAPMAAGVRDRVQAMMLREARIPMVDPATGTLVRDVTPSQWAAQVAAPLRLPACVDGLAAYGVRTYVELGPRSGLLPLVSGCLAPDSQVSLLPSLDPDDRGACLSSVGRHYVLGGVVDWAAFVSSRAGRRVPLPTYPFQRKRYWHDLPPALSTEAQSSAVASDTDPELWSLVESGNDSAVAGLLSASGALSDEARGALPEILKALSARRRDARKDAEIHRWQYAPVWRFDTATDVSIPDTTGSWLVLIDDGGAGEAVARSLEAHGGHCSRVHARPILQFVADGTFGVDVKQPDAVKALLGGLLGDLKDVRGVVSAWGLDESADGTRLAAALHAVQAVLSAQIDRPPRLWFLTRGAVSVGPSDRLTSPAQSMLWGFGRSVALEHPELWGGLVDLPESADDDDVTRVVSTIAAAAEDQVAVRAGGRFVERLTRYAGAGPARPWSASGAVLVTGGLGALGLHVARWLAERGAEHLVLTSRRGLAAPGAAEAVVALEAAGARVTVAEADVSDHDAMASVLADVARADERLTAVFHVAGVLDDGVLRNQTAARFRTVCRPKVEGARVLHELTRHMDLESFVLFSSATAALGSLAQSSYSAANAYLDALAHQRRQDGLAATSLGWGPWSGGGMITAQMEAASTRRGLNPLAVDDGLRALALSVAAEVPHLVLADVDWSRFRLGYEAMGPRPVLTELEGAAAVPNGESELARTLERTPLAQRRAKARQWLRELVADVIGAADAGEVDPHRGFFELGMDSLMAVDLRNRLQAELQIVVEATVAFEFPNVDALAGWILEALGLDVEREVAASEDVAVSQPPEAVVTEEVDDELAARVKRLEALLE